VVPPEKMEFQSIEAIKRCVSAGMGVSVLPSVAVEGELRSGELSALAWDRALDVRTRMAWHGERWKSPALRTPRAACTKGPRCLG
jgi:DNA-binding transcriptional LysR family regulator